MEQRNPEQEDCIIVNNEKNRLHPVDLNSLSRHSITRFEDLSNEIIYEIFDFIDFCQVYKAFPNLNIRFQNLLNYSTLPIRIDLSSLSKSTFQRYNTQIITPNQHRIESLHLSNPFIADLIFSPICNILKFTRLENLVFNNIKPEYLENILIHLRSLPYLSSLVIVSKGYLENQDTIYRQIFRLPVLKYCKLSLNFNITARSLSITTTEFSPIEHLVVKNVFDLSEIPSLLSYVPQLRRLSISLPHRRSPMPKEPYTTQLHHLTHVSLTMEDIKLTDFEFLMKNMLYQVQVLHISIHDLAYLDENRWKQFILSHMPHLRIFDIMISCYLHFRDNSEECLSMIEQFSSSFWFERQWFFEYHVRKDLVYGAQFIFYSINPYRRRHYNLIDEMSRKTCSFVLERVINSVRHVEIHNKKAIINCEKYFPNASELTIVRDSDNDNDKSLFIALKNIVPLKQITKLSLDSYSGNFSEIIELLNFLPTIHTFKIDGSLPEDTGLVTIQSSDTFRLLCRTNNIKEIIIKHRYSLEIIKFLIHLCPRLQHLTINGSGNSFESLLQSLLSKHNVNIRCLSSLCITQLSDREFRELESFIAAKKLPDVHLTEIARGIYNAMYFWW